MDDAVALNPGDPCPNCTGELKPAPVPTDEQARRLADRENPIVLDRSYDTAPAAVREALGALHRCGTCGYVTRFKDAVTAGAKGKKGKKDDAE
jgi:hypothetical protein